MTGHVPRGVVPESPVKGRLGRDAVRHLGMPGIRPLPHAHLDVALAGGVPQGLGKGVGLVAGCPLGGEHLPGGDALADQDSHPPAGASQMPPSPPGLQWRPKNACHLEARA